MLNQFNFKTHDKRFCIMPIDTQNPRMSDLNEIIGYFDFKSVLYRSNIIISPAGASIVNIADYSPFGVLLDGRTVSGDDYRYSFQNQEKDDEIKGKGNSVNYKYRMHDPRVGRFFAVDPLAYKFPYYSSYQFSSNSPIIAIELEGLETSIQLNYIEGSIDITRNKRNQFEVTLLQLSNIGPGGYRKNWNSNTKTFSGKRDNIDGTEFSMDVWCRNCDALGASKRGTGYYVTIFFPTEEVVDTYEVIDEVPRIIPGDPGTPDRPISRKGNEDFNITTDIGAGNGALISFAANDLTPAPGWDSREMISVNLVYFTGTTLDPNTVRNNFMAAFPGAVVTLTPSPTPLTHAIKPGLSYMWQAVTVWSEKGVVRGTDPTLAVTVIDLVPRTVIETLPPVVIIP